MLACCKNAVLVQVPRVFKEVRRNYDNMIVSRLQAKEWADQDVGKVHKSRLQRDKEAAAAARSALVHPPPDQANDARITCHCSGQPMLGPGMQSSVCGLPHALGESLQIHAAVFLPIHVLALRCRNDSLSSADRAATRRLVRSTFARAVDTQGKDLGEVRLPMPSFSSLQNLPRCSRITVPAP